jgi:hypothetical protein
MQGLDLERIRVLAFGVYLFDILHDPDSKLFMNLEELIYHGPSVWARSRTFLASLRWKKMHLDLESSFLPEPD